MCLAPSPEKIHFWPGSKNAAEHGDHSLNVSAIKWIKTDPVEKPATDRIMVEIAHDIYECFCDQARRSNVSPEEEAKRVITVRILEDATPEVVPKQNVRGNSGDAKPLTTH